MRCSKCLRQLLQTPRPSKHQPTRADLGGHPATQGSPQPVDSEWHTRGPPAPGGILGQCTCVTLPCYKYNNL